MVEETIPRQRNIKWTWIFNIVGILAIVLIGAFVYTVIRDTDDLEHDPLPDIIPQLSPEEVHERMQKNNQIILLDVRSIHEWENVPHAEGATSMPMTDVYGSAVNELDPDAEIIVMCYSHNTRSSKAAAFLQSHGFSNVSNLDGGLQAWNEAQLPTEPAINTSSADSDADASETSSDTPS